ncbi:hypothetical protein [Neobacillus kokaensis]|uniref:Uncharacterized protein n=1 Tax=Neobacillus kokaensis TaxID=2759023 RepID=A0ABQ3MUV8_9BACI|nr:hypothetical protein [Neobacillus kokaensis]GHH96464.1 hypothetical protein AM1BK_00070 [Neobacillus kokaensis]
MYLTSNDLAILFPEKQGIEDYILFHTVSDQANVLQSKGLFIPLNNQEDKLIEAIANGAVAAIWEEGKSLPPYTPNHFPVFFTLDLAEAVKQLLQLYLDYLNGEKNHNMDITNFKFSNKKLLNKNNETYDIAVMVNQIADSKRNNSERRG